MTWQAGSFAVLMIGLIAGFAWYERTRPDAKIVALVGTLAALAALGRLAFAAVPNVKPTGDIVLISGYALGGAPGYVVGATAALISNFFFGQGPWTPWQMAGWGATGVAGALLASVTGGRIRRLPLACVCFVLGFGFTALQDVGDWVNYSDHSLAQLGINVGQGIGFDLVYAVGCFGFAMLFGSAMIRTLQRFRRRVQVTWLSQAGGPETGAPALLAVAVLALGFGGGGLARGAHSTRHDSPLTYLLNAQNRDGGFGLAPGEPSSTMPSGWATIAIADGGADPRTASRPGGSSAMRYLVRTRADERGAGAIERTILAASTVSNDLGEFGSHLHALAKLPGRDGSVDEQTNLTAFGVLAMRSAAPAGMRVPPRMIAWLVKQQDRDGGFNFATGGGASDVDDTGAVLSALAGTGHPRAMRRAVTFIRTQQNRDGGFGDEQGAASNTQSSAFAVCGLIAAGVDPARMRRHGSPSPIAYLESMIQPGGAVDYARGDTETPVWVTAEVEIALSGHSLLVRR